MEGTREKKLTEPQPVWQEGIGSLLLLAAAHQTGFLAQLGTTIQGVASAAGRSLLPLNLAVVERLAGSGVSEKDMVVCEDQFR